MLALKNTHTFTTGEYIKLYENQILEGNLRTELIDGEINQLAPLGFRHAKTQKLLSSFIGRALKSEDVYTTGSTIADEYNMPEPDVFVLKPEVTVEGNYPHLNQVRMVVEVADSTINTDLINDGSGKLAKYAQCLVEVVWVVDVENKVIYQFTTPEGRFYSSTQRFDKTIHIGDEIAEISELVA